MSNETVSLRRLRPREPLSTELSKAFDPFAERKEKMQTEAAISPPKERSIRPLDQTKISPLNQFMSEGRKKIIGAGVLIICIASIIESSDRYHGDPSLGWMAALCAAWAMIVWLWPERFNKPKMFTIVKSAVKWLALVAIMAGAIQFGVREAYRSKIGVEKSSIQNDLSQKIEMYNKLYSYCSSLKDERDATVQDAKALAAEVGRLQKEKESSDYILALLKDSTNDESLLQEAKRIREALIHPSKF